MTAHFERGGLLLQQGRYEDAEREFRQHLAQEPNDPAGHVLLATALVEQDRYAEATEEVNTGIGLAPDMAFGHSARARILLERNWYAEAEEAAREALRLDPEDVDNYHNLAAVLVQTKRWEEALGYVDAGLALDAEDVDCLNLRAIILRNLGRTAEANDTMDAAMARQPDNSLTHANRGWAELQARDPKAAAESFREALRLDPESDYARYGIMEALKARNFIYRWMLAYFIWMSAFGARKQFAIIVGGYVIYRVLLGVAEEHPGVGPFVWPVLIAYIVFAVLTWVSYPLFNLLLRLDPIGRHALDREQRITANLVGGALGLCVVSLIAWLTVDGFTWLPAFVCLTAVIPLSSIMPCEVGWPRHAALAITFVLALFAAGLLYFQWTPGVPMFSEDELALLHQHDDTGFKLVGYVEESRKLLDPDIVATWDEVPSDSAAQLTELANRVLDTDRAAQHKRFMARNEWFLMFLQFYAYGILVSSFLFNYLHSVEPRR
jgi:tetratricopeptide (TPR) repeat protein